MTVLPTVAGTRTGQGPNDGRLVEGAGTVLRTKSHQTPVRARRRNLDMTATTR